MSRTGRLYRPSIRNDVAIPTAIPVTRATDHAPRPRCAQRIIRKVPVTEAGGAKCGVPHYKLVGWNHDGSLAEVPRGFLYVVTELRLCNTQHGERSPRAKVTHTGFIT